MGLLTDEPSEPSSTGEGQKFVDMWLHDFDNDDRALVREWVELRRYPASEVWRRLHQHGFHVGETVVRKGLRRLKESGWDA
jgi:hypothetical protein